MRFCQGLNWKKLLFFSILAVLFLPIFIFAACVSQGPGTEVWSCCPGGTPANFCNDSPFQVVSGYGALPGAKGLSVIIGSNTDCFCSAGACIANSQQDNYWAQCSDGTTITLNHCVSKSCPSENCGGNNCACYSTALGTCGGGLPNGSYCTAGSQCSGGYCCDNVCGSSPCSYTCIPQGTNCLGQESRCCSGLSCQLPNWYCQCTPCPNPSTYCPGQTVQDGCGNSCSGQGTQICDPGPPTNFSHSANTINTITWSWIKPIVGYPYYGTPTKYQILDSLGNLIADNIPTTACSGSNCSWQETNLSTNTSYARFVKACNQTVCSDPSNTANAYTSIQPVDSIQCTSIGLNTIQVTAYSAGGLGFSDLTYGSSGIRFQRPGFDAGYQQSNTYTFANLSPSTTYTFTAGPSKNGDSENTAGTANVTCDTVATLPAPVNLHHTGNTINTIDWAWNAVPSTTYYNIYSKYFSNGNPYWQLKTNITDITYHQTDYYAGTSYGWWALTENAMYGFGVSACNVNGCSGLSMADAATSILPPSDIDCQNITQTSIRDFAVGSLANLTLGSSGIIFREAGGATQDSQSRYWNLLNLTPETNYSFYAKARNQDGELSAEFGPKTCSTLSPTAIPYSLRIYGPSSSILKLALISVEDALSLNRGTIKTRMPWGDNYAAYLVATSSPNASPVRVMTPMGIKAWRLGP